MHHDPIAVIVLAELQRRGLGIRDLSARTGVGRHVLGRWLAGRRTIRLCHLVPVLGYLDLVVAPRRSVHADPRPVHPASR